MPETTTAPITIGDRLPAIPIHTWREGKPHATHLAAWAGGRRVLLFTLPGAFTPTCTVKHLPGFIDMAGLLRGKGIAAIGCMAVNDIFVLAAWGEANKAAPTIDMLADTNGAAANALGIAMQSHAVLGAGRATRSVLIAEAGVISHFYRDAPGEFAVSSAEYVLGKL